MLPAMPVKRGFPTLLMVLIVLAACTNRNGNAQSPQVKETDDSVIVHKDISIPGGFSDQRSITFDSVAIRQFTNTYPLFNVFRNDLLLFYRKRDFAYAWFDNKGLIEQAENVFNHVINIRDEGLPDKIPYKSEFENLMDSITRNNQPSVMAELMLTAQYLVYAKKAWQGLPEKQSLSAAWFITRKKVTIKQLLDSLVSDKDILTDAPVYRQYALLKDYLKKYNRLKQQGGWKAIKAEKKVLKKGDSTAAISSIRERLLLTGDLAINNHSNRFDDELETGIKNYQRRCGLKEDGLINAALVNDLNVPVEKRIEQIVVNMERCRWVPVKLNQDYLVINIPEFKVHVYEKDQLAWSMKVVVGKSQHKTAIFNGEIQYIVFSPYWNIPNSIYANEIRPAMRRNRNYLASHDMEWSSYGLRQKPGPNNALGLVKFLFPNSHNIYLHDTPVKSLFKEDKRAFSHGCIRLEDAKRLAMYLLRDDKDWDEVKILAAMNAGKEQVYTLKKKVPVFIAYFTSWVDREGKIHFVKDIYDRDSRLAGMIMEAPLL